jgi:glycosyltransferase involved in cell wall biosynthesis
LSNPERAKAIGRDARAYFERHLNTPAAAKRLEAVLNAAVRSAARLDGC